jgi:hypothetical protein
MRCSVNWIKCDRMLSWSNLKCYVDWNICDSMLSRTIWSNMWIWTGDKGWCHDLIWRDTWIGAHDKGCCLVQFKVLYELDSMWQEVTRPIWNNIWIRTDDTWWCLDLIWGALWMKKLWMYAVLTLYEVLCGLERMWHETFTTSLK